MSEELQAAWMGVKSVLDAMLLVEKFSAFLSEDERYLVAFERMSHVVADPQSTLKSVEVYGLLRQEIIKRMSRR